MSSATTGTYVSVNIIVSHSKFWSSELNHSFFYQKPHLTDSKSILQPNQTESQKINSTDLPKRIPRTDSNQGETPTGPRLFLVTNCQLTSQRGDAAPFMPTTWHQSLHHHHSSSSSSSSLLFSRTMLLVYLQQAAAAGNTRNCCLWPMYTTPSVQMSPWY